MCFRETFQILIHLTVIAVIRADQYEESLLIKPQQDGTVAAHFEFKTLWASHHLHSHWKSHYDLFPLAIGSLLNEHEIHELHFSLTNGYWRHARWGMPPRSAMSGAELWLWLSPFHSDPHSAWSKINSQLSSQFCTSIDFEKNPVSVNPSLSFRPEGLMDRSLLKNSSVFFAGLASESVCTENLTPWKKLLPTFAKSGLGTLLSATHLFDSSYTSIALDVRPVCDGEPCETIHTEMVLSLTVVFNTAIGGKQSWSLFKLFGATVPHISPLASSTTILVDISTNSTENPYELVPAASSTPVKKAGKTLVVYDLSQYFNASANSSSPKPFNLAGKYAKNHKYGDEVPPEITITRSVTGYGLHSGGIMARITNSNQKAIRVIYMDVLPWYFRVYLHTLKITMEDNSRKSRPVHIQPESLVYTPSLSRVSPHHVELLITLPGNSVTTVTMDFDRTFLRWTEYPPDANHGLYGGSAILTYRSPGGATDDASASSKRPIVRLYTECLLISLPTPDFSMPYNVICLVSTVLSLAFGPIYSLTTRVIQPADIGGTKKGALTTIINKIKSKFTRIDKDKKE